jgi:hypothetical protein
MSAEELSARRALPGLLAGLVLLDLLMNLPVLAPASAAGSLLVPSIDLLVIVAACIGIAQAGEGSRVPLRVAAAVLAVLLVAWKTGTRFGFDLPWRLFGDGTALAAAGCLVSFAALAAVGVAVFLLSGLLVRAFVTGMARSIALLVIAAAAVTQVLLGRTVFAASIVPRIIRDVGSWLR